MARKEMLLADRGGHFVRHAAGAGRSVADWCDNRFVNDYRAHLRRSCHDKHDVADYFTGGHLVRDRWNRVAIINNITTQK